VGSAPPPGEYPDYQVIVLVSDEYQPPSTAFPGVRVRRFPFNDVPNPSPQDFDIAWQAAEAVARDLALGRRVLVTCRMGRNRSGLVAALALHILTGASGAEVLDIVSSRRRDALGVKAISNPAFQQYLLNLD
jgi:protein-tyrosine phosphatase